MNCSGFFDSGLDIVKGLRFSLALISSVNKFSEFFKDIFSPLNGYIVEKLQLFLVFEVRTTL